MNISFKKQKQPPLGRRRPLTPGGRAPQAFSYHARRAEEEYNTGRAQPREQDIRRQERLIRYWRSRLGMLAALIIILICVFNVLLLSNDPKVVPLTGSSSTGFLQSPATYEHAAEALFKSSVFNDNKITVNTSQVVAHLKAEFPELSDASITLPLIGHRPILYISPAIPSIILTTKNQQSFVLDQRGRALVSTDKFSGAGSLAIPVVTDESGIAIKPSDTALPSSAVSFIETIAAQLAAEHFTVSAYILPVAANELDVHLKGVSYFVKFNMHNNADAKQQAGAFVATANYLTGEHIVPSQYIDVRVDGRAYYK
jgi:hypothetical protein